MINKTYIEKARQQFKEETTKLVKLVNELTKKREKTATPSSPLKPKSIETGIKEFNDLVAKRAEKLAKSGEYLNYLGNSNDNTITA